MEALRAIFQPSNRMVLWGVGLGLLFWTQLSVSPSPFQSLSQGVLQDLLGATEGSLRWVGLGGIVHKEGIPGDC